MGGVSKRNLAYQESGGDMENTDTAASSNTTTVQAFMDAELSPEKTGNGTMENE